jgi:signal transduction histidine kinase
MGSFLIAYLKFQRTLLALFGLTAGLFLAVQFLSGGYSEFTGYTVLLCAIVLILLLAADAPGFYRRHRTLREIALSAPSFETEFPEPANLIERDYIGLARELKDRLCRAQDKLGAANAGALEYYTLWVHQIKTPISALRLVLENDEIDKTVILKELFSIERYADLALQYARLSGIASDIVIEDCDLNAIVRESVKKYALLFIYKKLSVDLHDLSFSVKSDAKWLRFIIEQLISNAVKYTPSGKVEIFFSGNALTVKDTGIGIRPEDIPRLFEKGYTGFNGRIDERASGIGLYLSKKAADALSIQIGVESAVGQGTSMRLTFPSGDEWIYE